MKNKDHKKSKESKKSQAELGTNELRKLGLATVILSDLVVFTGAGVGIGYWVWAKWGAPWWVVLIASSVGLILAFYRMYKISQKETE